MAINEILNICVFGKAHFDVLKHLLFPQSKTTFTFLTDKTNLIVFDLNSRVF